MTLTSEEIQERKQRARVLGNLKLSIAMQKWNKPLTQNHNPQLLLRSLKNLENMRNRAEDDDA